VLLVGAEAARLRRIGAVALQNGTGGADSEISEFSDSLRRGSEIFAMCLLGDIPERAAAILARGHRAPNHSIVPVSSPLLLTR
jgi:hypothetical protein